MVAMATDAPLTGFDEARRLVAERCKRLPAETLDLRQAFDRILAEGLTARHAVPPFDNSALDGYAVIAADLERASPESPVQLRIVAESRAGSPADRSPERGEAVAISTGAVLPEGADAILPIERARPADDGFVAADAPIAPGTGLRRRGDDLNPGDPVAAAGTKLGPAELGSLASVGIAEVPCVRRPTVAVFTTGDELVMPGTELRPGQIHNASLFSIPALVRRSGALTGTVDNIPDRPGRTLAAIEAALSHDMVVLCGGVSVGRHDHVKNALKQLAVEQIFWRIAIRPGKPLWFGRHSSGTLVFGLPGNPVSAMVTFHLFVAYALNLMLGTPAESRRVVATMTEAHEKPLGRTDFVRCRLTAGPDGWLARLTRPDQASHVLTSMLGAEGLAMIPADLAKIEPGTQVPVEMLPG